MTSRVGCQENALAAMGSNPYMTSRIGCQEMSELKFY